MLELHGQTVPAALQRAPSDATSSVPRKKPNKKNNNHYKHLVGVNNFIIYPTFAFPSFILFIGEATENRTKNIFFLTWKKAFVFCYAELIYQIHYLNIQFVGFYLVFFPFFF